MDMIGYMAGSAYRLNNVAQTPVATGVSDRMTQEVVATSESVLNVQSESDQKKKKLAWRKPEVMESITAIDKEKGILEQTPVFVERRRSMKAVKVERRASGQRRTVQAEDAAEMNEFQRAARTNKVGEYYLQKYGKNAPKNGAGFTLNA